jgi:hypothetical protein
MPGRSVSILIPYGYRSDWEEKLLFNVEKHWEHHFPDVEVVLGDGGSPFNRAAARNNAASRTDAEILIFCDSDTLFVGASEVDVALASIHMGAVPRWYGCRNYYMCSKKYTEDRLGLIMNLRARRYPWDKMIPHPPGGIVMCRRPDFEAAGGFDEGFQGWGYEDSAFHAAMEALWGRPGHFGDVYHLWHPKTRAERQEQPHIHESRERYQRYLNALHDGKEAMLDLLHTLNLERNT